MKERSNGKGFDIKSAIDNFDLMGIINFLNDGKDVTDILSQGCSTSNVLYYAKKTLLGVENISKQIFMNAVVSSLEITNMDFSNVIKAAHIYYAIYIYSENNNLELGCILNNSDISFLSDIGKRYIKSAYIIGENHFLGVNDYLIWSNFIIKHFLELAYKNAFNNKENSWRKKLLDLDWDMLVIWYLSYINLKSENLSQDVSAIYKYMNKDSIAVHRKNFMTAMSKRLMLVEQFSLQDHEMVKPFLPKEHGKDSLEWLKHDFFSDSPPETQNEKSAASSNSHANAKKKTNKRKKLNKKSSTSSIYSSEKEKNPNSTSEQSIKNNDTPSKPVHPKKITINTDYIDAGLKKIKLESDPKNKCSIFYEYIYLISYFSRNSIDLKGISEIFNFSAPDVEKYDYLLKGDYTNKFISVLISSTLTYCSKPNKNRTAKNRMVMSFIVEALQLLRVDKSSLDILSNLYDYFNKNGLQEFYLVGGLATLLVQHSLDIISGIGPADFSDMDLIFYCDRKNIDKLLEKLNDFGPSLQKSDERYSSHSITFQGKPVDLIIYSSQDSRSNPIDTYKSFVIDLRGNRLVSVDYKAISLLFKQKRYFDTRAFSNNPYAIAYYFREFARNHSFEFYPRIDEICIKYKYIINKAVCLYLTKYVYSTSSILYEFFCNNLLNYFPKIKEIKQFSRYVTNIMEQMKEHKSDNYKNRLPLVMMVVNEMTNNGPMPSYDFPISIKTNADKILLNLKANQVLPDHFSNIGRKITEILNDIQ